MAKRVVHSDLHSQEYSDVPPVVRDLFDPVTGEVLRIPVMRTAYDGFAKRVSIATSIVFPLPSEEEYSALQSFRDECDINNIVARMETDQFDRFADRVDSGSYADLSSLPDFQSSMNIIVEAQAAFADLPANIRREFDNDPSQFLAFIDRGDRAEFERLGLVPKAPPSPPLPPKTNSEGSDDPEVQA